MSRTPPTVALVALTGFLGTTALGAVTTAHVAFEHSHHSEAAAANEHAHDHPSDAPTSEHAHSAEGEVHRDKAPGHRHPPALVAHVLARGVRTTVEPVAGGAVDTPAALVMTVVRPILGPTSRAGPVARTAPLSRRSVVLQV